MKAVIGDMTISTGGTLRLNKGLMERMRMKPGDRLIILQDIESTKITIQVQRESKVIFRLNEAEIIRPENRFDNEDSAIRTKV